MTTLDFAQKCIRFSKSSPVTGKFNLPFYPFLRKPMEAADDITCKRLVIFKAASCLGTVLGQIINSKRIVCDVGDQLMVCQTDDDAEKWSKTRGKEWLKAIPDVMRLLSRESYAITNSLWLFRHKFLLLTGPGISSQQSDQVRFLQTDESHLDSFAPGSLEAFAKRMGGRWDRQETHITTAPDEGKETDIIFNAGQQDEWHFRCPKCAKLFWPLWGTDAHETYGKPVFDYNRRNEIACYCPHCGKHCDDTARDRYALVRDGDYVSQNPAAPSDTRSFRWSVFAAHWIAWRDVLTESNDAMAAAKLGNLTLLEQFHKKRLCKSWKPFLPDFGDGKGTNNYRVGETWEVTDSIRVLTADLQAGKADEGAHIHALVTQWDREGNSRRICYRRIQTFAELHIMAGEFGVQEMTFNGSRVAKRSHVMVDSGHENRLVFRECSKYGWYAFRGSDAAELFHTEMQNGEQITFGMPYSHAEPQSGIVGEKQPERLRGVRAGALPPGWAFCIAGANPQLYGILSALLGGRSGRYFGIASDFPECYTSNMPAFIQVVEKDKKTNRDKTTWRLIRQAHWWDLEVMALVVAARSGYFPLAKPGSLAANSKHENIPAVALA